MPFEDIEKKWQTRWREAEVFKTPENPGEDKFYLLEMFAYPSGDVHMGHFRNYSIGDLVWRYMRMRGKKMLHPFGWDSFGLPAEQAAIKRGVHPGEWTERNIATGKSTLQALGVSFDWEREIATSRPEYYKWTQWVFVQLYKRGLAYQKEAMVNWCPECNTVLANEQVTGGCCWRHENTPVQRKSLKQWFFKITDYAQRLLDDLDKLEHWSDTLKGIQRYWIGRSEGANVLFSVVETGDDLPVFTTRPDTVYGVTFMAIAPEAELMKKLVGICPNREAVEEYIQKTALKSEIERMAEDREKDGVFTGLHVHNPFNGDNVPLFVADYVLAGYGSGAVMAVPAHDQRDFEFAKKYDIKIEVVINPKGVNLDPGAMTEAFTEPGFIVNSAQFNGMESLEAKKRIVEFGAVEHHAEPTIQFRLRDWLISRQRYWGAPIPVVHCEKCGIVPVPEEDLPVILPHVEDFLPRGRSPLSDVPEFMNTTCPVCGGPARRDPDTMDTYVCSSWYELRYLDPNNDSAAFSVEEAKKWFPVDLYIGGIEHATSHLLYFRWITKVLFDMGLLPVDEPVVKMFNHGMVCDEQGDKMSKSKGNVISPIEIADKHGVDVSRTAMFFFAPPGHEISWNEDGMKGAERFLRRIDSLVSGNIDKSAVADSVDGLNERDMELYKTLHRTIKAVTDDIEGMSYNTAIARLMEFINIVSPEDMAGSRIAYSIADSLARMIAPFAPHLAEELNERLGYDEFIVERQWPTWDESVIALDTVEIGVQVSGKLRGTINISPDADQDTAIKSAMEVANVQRNLEGKKILKVIYVKGRILNIIAK
ncbi:leucine--tRNA ligase [bacterium]|nr:leucine--tRNA ligase [bacterium]